jgi:glycine/D-amino acid oxidase-like deaminating enzyme
VETILAEAKSNLTRSFPAFKDMTIAGRWAGLIDVTPDAVPVISPVQALPGFFLASGFSGHGFGIGPASGRLIADLVAGDRPIVDPAPFRFERLARASRRDPLRAPPAEAASRQVRHDLAPSIVAPKR